MTKAAFDKIAEGLQEALAIARGTAEPAQWHVPEEIDVRSIRIGTGLAQEEFARAFGFTVHQIRQWEQGRHRPLGAMRAYLVVIGRNPSAVLTMLQGGVEQARAA
jgi:putative transcriptional regulator